jgi:hypothetical protein
VSAKTEHSTDAEKGNLLLANLRELACDLINRHGADHSRKLKQHVQRLPTRRDGDMARPVPIRQLVLREVRQRAVLPDAVQSELVLAEVWKVEDRQPGVRHHHVRVRRGLRTRVIPGYAKLSGLGRVAWKLEDLLVDLLSELARQQVELEGCNGLAVVVRRTGYCALFIKAAVGLEEVSMLVQCSQSSDFTQGLNSATHLHRRHSPELEIRLYQRNLCT